MNIRENIRSIKDLEQYKKIKLLGKKLRSSKLGSNFPTRLVRKFLVKEIKKYFFRRKLNTNTPIFVFQMGKVGSRSIADSLKSSYPGLVVHRHAVEKDDWETEYILDWVKNGKPLKIISPVREPVGRNVSAFFHFIEGRLGHASDKTTLSVPELVELFINNSDPNEREENKGMMKHSMPLEWFDNNIKEYFGIDVYESSFPTNGYAQFSRDNVSLLVLRIDVNDRVKEGAVRDFLQYPEFKLDNTNIGSSKKYASKYREFKESAVLPDSYLHDMCESKFFRHFYNSEEIDRIKKQWMKK